MSLPEVGVIVLYTVVRYAARARPLTLVSGGDILPSAVIFKPSAIRLKPVVSIDTENCLLSRNLPERSTSSTADVGDELTPRNTLALTVWLRIAT